MPKDPHRPLRIGVLAEKTGVMAAHGRSIEMGARVAERVLNQQSGILKRHVEVISLDTQSSPTVTAERARELIERNGVELLIGTGLSSSTLAAIPVVVQARTPFIYSMDGECKTCAPGDPKKAAPFVWGAGFTERMAVDPFLRYLVEHVLPKKAASSVFFLGGDYVYPRATNAYARRVAESLGLKVVGDEYVDVDTRDYSPIIRRIGASGADLLLVTHPGEAAVAFMRQAKQFDLDKQLIISGFATFAQETIASMGNAADGVYYLNRYSDTLDNPANVAFLEDFRAMYPNEPFMPGPSVAAGGYGPIMLAAAAFERAGSTDPEKFAQMMSGLELELPQGRVVVDPENHIVKQHLYLLQIADQKYSVIADLGLFGHPDFDGCSVR